MSLKEGREDTCRLWFQGWQSEAITLLTDATQTSLTYWLARPPRKIRQFMQDGYINAGNCFRQVIYQARG